MYTEQLPPHDDQAEEAVLGSMIIDSDCVPDVAEVLTAADFFRQRHAWVFEACLVLFDRNEPVNQVSVADELAKAGRLEDAGGQPFLSHLIAGVPTSVYAVHYAQIVRRMAKRRGYIAAGGRIVQVGYEGADDEEAMDRLAEAAMDTVRQQHDPATGQWLADSLDEYLEAAMRPAARGGVKSGFGDLDNLLGGFSPTDMIVMAARPGVGKTALALNIAKTVTGEAREDGSPKVVAFFSLEMSEDQLDERMLAGESGVNSTRIRKGHDAWTEQERYAIFQARDRLASHAIWIDDRSGLTARDIRAKARRVRNEAGLDMIIVDYLQLMAGQGNTGNRVQDVTEISRALKTLAKDLNVPVLALSQLSRAVENRQNHEPQLSDLRESGSIEQDADVVMFLYRPDFYFTEEEWERKHPGEEYPRGMVDVIVAKHRHGPIGRVQLVFRERTTTFEGTGRAAPAHEQGSFPT